MDAEAARRAGGTRGDKREARSDEAAARERAHKIRSIARVA